MVIFDLISFSAMSFFSNMIWSVIGLGHATTFILFFESIGIFHDNEHELTFALFIQAISILLSVIYLGMVLLVKKVPIDYYLCVPLGIMTVLFTPLGSLVQTYVNQNVIRIICCIIIYWHKGNK